MMWCPLCEGRLVGCYDDKHNINKWITDDPHISGIRILNNFLEFDNSNDACERQSLKINYCPICGRRL